MAQTYRINEIFYSLQGEGFHTGTPAVFIRFSGCNLSCPFCDTDFASYEELTVRQIAERVEALLPEETQQFRSPILVLTGGEPALQTDAALLEVLHRELRLPIHIETNGTLPLPDGIDWITCSPKEGTKLALTNVNEVKVVFTGTYDPEVWRTKIEAEHWMLQPLRYTGEWLLEHAVDEWEDDRNDNLDDTVRYILSHPFWRLSVQLHKIVGLR